MKRYTIVEHSYGDGNSSMELRHDDNGDIVYYSDVEPILNSAQILKAEIAKVLDVMKNEEPHLYKFLYYDYLSKLWQLSTVQ